MPANGIVTLSTDFGTLDPYVGVMKGVMLQINPALTLVDLTHHIPAQNIEVGAFQLQTAYPHFPSGTVHVAIVDPGVGSHRRAIALETVSGYFVGPDNGLFSNLLHKHRQLSVQILQAIALNNSDYWYTRLPSATFQGRDIFAPVAAHLASGIPITALGEPTDINSLIALPQINYEVLPTGVNGTILAIDSFGNAITNIPGNFACNNVISGQTVINCGWWVKVGNQVFPGQSTYSAVNCAEPLSLVGSHGRIELALRNGSAQHTFGLNQGDRVQLRWTVLQMD